MEEEIYLPDIDESEDFSAESVRPKEKEFDRDEMFEDLNGFESDVFPDELEAIIEKYYKHEKSENFRQKGRQKCYTDAIENVRLEYTFK